MKQEFNIFDKSINKEVPVWETPIFVEWYVEQLERAAEDQSPGFKEFMKKVEAGELQVPTDAEIARYKLKK